MLDRAKLKWRWWPALVKEGGEPCQDGPMSPASGFWHRPSLMSKRLTCRVGYMSTADLSPCLLTSKECLLPKLEPQQPLLKREGISQSRRASRFSTSAPARFHTRAILGARREKSGLLCLLVGAHTRTAAASVRTHTTEALPCDVSPRPIPRFGAHPPHHIHARHIVVKRVRAWS